MTSIFAGHGRAGLRFQVVGVLVLAVGCAASWFAWMGWDQQYQVDPATGVRSGPYEAWQVIGCALTLLVMYVGALFVGVRPLLAGAALTLAFTTAWTVQAASGDDTGLFGVGTVMLLVGLSVTSTVVGLVTLALRNWLIAGRHG